MILGFRWLELLTQDSEEMKLVREQLGHHQNLTKERSNECTELLRQLEDVKRYVLNFLLTLLMSTVGRQLKKKVIPQNLS